MMKSSVMKVAKAFAIAAAVFIAPAALASPAHHKEGHNREGQRWKSVPEFDPSAGGALLALLSGGGLLIARRRRNDA